MRISENFTKKMALIFFSKNEGGNSRKTKKLDFENRKKVKKSGF